MNLTSELGKLQEIPLPVMPGLWPQTWGWVAVAGLIFVLVTVGLVFWKRRQDANAYRREAMAELDALYESWQQHSLDFRPLRDIPELLKRAALSRPALPGESQAVTEIAAMTGTDWQQRLKQMARTPLSEGFADNLATLTYANDEALHALDVTRLVAECRHWLETHHDPV